MYIVNAMNSESLSISSNHIAVGMMSDDLSEPSSPEASTFDENDLLGTAMGCSDDVTSQLAAAGPVGVAAAAAIISGKKRRQLHSFEINPSIRKRQQTRLLRKLKNIIQEYCVRVGQQACVVVCTPGKMTQSYQSFKVFGSQPLENVLRNHRSEIMQTLETDLLQHAPPQDAENLAQHDLPPLVIDGIPTPVDKMTQAQLRAFIPEMLKYSTGRSKPSWGKMAFRPLWWPADVPWANVRSDVRTEEEKKRLSWTHALRMIVKNCYKHHNREDLLPVFDEYNQCITNQNEAFPSGTMVQTISNPDGTLSIIQIDTGSQNGTFVTLPDGTQATVVHATLPTEATHGVTSTSNETGNSREVSTFTDESLAHGQLLITGNGSCAVDSEGNKYGIVTIPVSMYQSMTNSANLTAISDSTGVRITVTHSGDNQRSSCVPDATAAVEVETIKVENNHSYNVKVS